MLLTTIADIQTEALRSLRDVGGTTFGDDIDAMVSAGIIAVGRIAPREFQQDIAFVANQVEYPLLASDFPLGIPEVRVLRVEVWTGSPASPYYVLSPSASEHVTSADVGWFTWNGVLTIPTFILRLISGNEANYTLRVWGYAPYALSNSSDDPLPMSQELAWAVIDYCRVDGIERLIASRDLYTQWQTHAGNTDVSMTQLMSNLNIARDQWKRTSSAIQRLITGF